MKIKLDFITNSSSCCYIISSSKKITRKQISDMGFPTHLNDFHCLGNIEKLIEYADCEPCDWVKKATGARRFFGCHPRDYHKYKKIIEEGKFVVIAHVERNFDEVEIFDRIISEMSDCCEVLEREYD